MLRPNTIVQVCRGDMLRNYHPTKASWKRFVNLALRDRLQKQYGTFRVITSAGYREAR